MIPVSVLIAQICTFTPKATAASIDTRNRAAVLAAYNEEFNRREPPSEWTGEVSTCRSGSTSPAYQSSVLQRVNWYRNMAGLPSVAYDTALNQRAQDGALISSAEGALSHTPASTAKCWTSSGRTGTENSNLALGLSGTSAVDGYIDDTGDNNTQVGHRAWLLSRSLGPIATGDIESNGTHASANAIYVGGGGGTTASPRDGFIAWPPSGYVPDRVVYTRWSFNTTGTNVSYQGASVTVTGPDGQVPTTIGSRNGWLEPGLVFTPEISVHTVTSDVTYRVNISGITGGSSSSYQYDVTVIHVNSPPKVVSASGWGAPACASPNSNLAQINLSDPDGDSTSYSLVSGYGDTDNRLFTVNQSGVIQNVAELDVGRTTYRVRYGAVDSNGWETQGTHTITLKNPLTDTSVVCPGRNLRIAPDSKGGVRVSWEKPVTGSTDTWYVFFSPGGAFCAVKIPGCDVSTLKAGTTYKVDLYNVRGQWSVPHTTSFTYTPDQLVPTTTVPATDKSTLKRGATSRLSVFGSLPSGKKSFRTTGPCRVNAARLTVTAGTSATGLCRVKVTAVTVLKTGRRLVRTKSISFRVV